MKTSLYSRLFSAGLLLCSISQAYGWGQKGHDVTAAIAERHLTPVTAQAIDSILGGKSIIYWSNWLDNASHTPDYSYTRTWHYRNIDPEYTYQTMPAAPGGDVVTAIIDLNRNLNAGTYDKKKSAEAVKMLVHLMGDLHQPLHMGWKKDRGGNQRTLFFFDRETNLHSAWDSSLPDAAHKWSYTEWADQIDRTDGLMQMAILQGSIDDWGRETYSIAQDVYDATPAESKISYDYIAAWTPVIEQQFLKGGLRLAHLLNTIFDPGYSAK